MMKKWLLKNIDYGVYLVGINIWLLSIYFVYYSILIIKKDKVMTTEMPKYLQVKFKKATNLIKPEHKKFVDNEVKYMLENNYKETGAKYDSEVGGEYRAFKNDENVYVAIAPNNFYIIPLN